MSRVSLRTGGERTRFCYRTARKYLWNRCRHSRGVLLPVRRWLPALRRGTCRSARWRYPYG